MNYLKENPVGVDKPIKKIQEKLYEGLSALGDLNGYGRIYKNKNKDRFVMEAYVGNGEYESVTGQDKSNFFFYVDDIINFNDAPSASINVIFFLNLNDFFSENNYRMDEEIRQKVIKVLEKKPFILDKMVSGVDFVNNILKGYLNGKSIINGNIHPYHVFTVQGSVTYNYKNCT